MIGAALRKLFEFVARSKASALRTGRAGARTVRPATTLNDISAFVARSDHSHATDRPGGGNPPSPRPPGHLLRRSARMIGTALRSLIGRRPEPEPEHLVACSWPDCGRFSANPYRAVSHAVRLEDCACERLAREQRRGA